MAYNDYSLGGVQTARRGEIQPMREQRGDRLSRRIKTVYVVVSAVLGLIIAMGAVPNSLQRIAALFKRPEVKKTGAGGAGPSPRTCKPTGNPRVFSVEGHFWPTGKTGDIGDVGIAPLADLERFTYTTNGHGPHEYEWKWVDGKLNPEPAQFVGVMYLNPANNFGKDPTGGFDLRGYRLVKWGARSLTGRVNVGFSMGGVTWVWDNKTLVQVTPPFPESLSVKTLGIQTLDSNWQEFEAPFAPEDDLRCVINGFAWTINWPSNDVRLNETRTGPENPRTFQFEVRDIRYER